MSPPTLPKQPKSTAKQIAQREINYAIYRLKGMHFKMPGKISPELYLAHKAFKDATETLIKTLKTEHLRRTK